MALFNPAPIAAQFWRLVGYEEDFPRALNTAVALALPASIIFVPALSAAVIDSWLRRRDINCTLRAASRPLRGCLIANRGHGLIFVDGTMAADEMRITVAHETVHFLHHYLNPRMQALEKFGEGIRVVLDGDRLATPAERLAGVLRGMPLGTQAHLLDRRPDGALTDTAMAAEIEADLAAFELIAPTKHVLARTEPGEPRRRALIDAYGFPPWASLVWGNWLDGQAPGDPLIRRLRAASKPS